MMVRQELPDGDSDAYKNDETLEELYVERGWTREEISQYFGVTSSVIKYWLEKHEIRKESQIPCNGPAADLRNRGMQEAGE